MKKRDYTKYYIVRLSLEDGSFAYLKHSKNTNVFTTKINEVYLYRIDIVRKRLEYLENCMLLNFDNFRLIGSNKKLNFSFITIAEKIEAKETRTITLVEG